MCADILPTDEPMPVLQPITQPPTTAAPTRPNYTPPPTAPYLRAAAILTLKNGASGRLDVFQADASAPTNVVVWFGSNSNALGAYQITANPVFGDSCDDTGGMYNPAGLPSRQLCVPTDVTSCQVGDLSTKHGQASGTYYVAAYNDANLPISGQFGVGPRLLRGLAYTLARRFGWLQLSRPFVTAGHLVVHLSWPPL